MARMSVFDRLISSLPASIFLASRMSSMIRSSEKAELRIIPDSIDFVEGLINIGPDADRKRESDGNIYDASDSGLEIRTFTSHRSPLGLVYGYFFRSIYCRRSSI